MNGNLFRHYLIEGKIVDQEYIDLALETYPRMPLWQSLEQLGFATEEDMYEKLAATLGVHCLDLSEVMLSSFALQLVAPRLLRKCGVVPISCDHDRYEVATSCPGDWETEEVLRLATDREIVERLARPSQIMEVLDSLLGEDNLGIAAERALAVEHEERSIMEEMDPQKFMDFGDVKSGKGVVKVFNRLLKNAIHRRASDLHIEPVADGYGIRARIDGELTLVSHLTRDAGNSVVTRIKVLAKMDIAKKLRPQDGSLTVETKGVRYDMRASSLPTPRGEKMVLRILDPEYGKIKLSDLGLLPDVRQPLARMSRDPQGLIIFTGPTSSGKSTTLWGIINTVKSDVANIVSVEDPIEYRIEGVNQTAVNPQQGMTFATALRAILRQDPNVIYIGEIRDAETAEIACQAAQTGHMVFSTLHTNDAASAITRLLSISVSPNVLADALTAVVAQRLTRRVCPECAESVEPSAEELELLSPLGVELTLRRGQGCPVCGGAGYLGRIAATELLCIDRALRQMIVEGRSAGAIMKHARDAGMRTMWETGLHLVAMGVTTLEELGRHVPQALVARTQREMPETLLAVDDDPNILAVLQTVLSDSDTELLTANDGADALQMVDAALPDFILTDVHMPNLDGLSFCRKLRLNPKTADVPIIVMTGEPTEETECTSLDIGASDFIRKPFSPRALVARIRAVHRRHQAAAISL